MTNPVQVLVDRTVRLTQIPAPTFDEQDRASQLFEWWTIDGVGEVVTDAQGNLFSCIRPGLSPQIPAIVVCAHLDTVFSRDTTHQVRWDGERLIGPSVADDSVALAALSLINDCLAQQLHHPVWIAATTAEEGLGNLAGVTYLLDHFPGEIGALVALEGNYLGRVNITGVGSVRGRVDVSGQGGHSWEEPDNPNAVESSVACLQGILEDYAAIRQGSRAKATVNVGRISGGESVNSRARFCSFDIEARSDDPDLLGQLEGIIKGRMEELSPAFDVVWTEIGRRPAGGIDKRHPLARVAADVLLDCGIEPTFSAASTDANAAYARNIPAITIGLAFGGNTHTEDEWIDTKSLNVGFKALCNTVERLATEGW